MQGYKSKLSNILDKNELEMNMNNIFENKQNREEIIKIMMQSLEQMGFEKTVETMMNESKVWIETVEMKKFKSLVQQSQWQNAIEYSSSLPFQDEKSWSRCKYLIYRQWYFESLLLSQTDQALNLLRNSLKPLATPFELSILSSLIAYSEQKDILNQINSIIYSSDDNNNLNKKQTQINSSNPNNSYSNNNTTGLNTNNQQTIIKDVKNINIPFCKGLFSQDGNNNDMKQNQQKQQLLQQQNISRQQFQDSYTYLIHCIWDLIKERISIPPVNRLNTIVKQAKSYQILKCPVHTQLQSNFSIIEDHICRTQNYPNILASQQKVHEDEVWHVQFSPNGLYAASICKKSTIAIWRLVKKKSTLQLSNNTPKLSSSSVLIQNKKRKSNQTISKDKLNTQQSNEQLLKNGIDSTSITSLNQESSEGLNNNKQQIQEESLLNKKKKNLIKPQGKEKKLSKKEINNKNNNSKINKQSRVELELVVKKDLDDSSAVQCFSWNQKGNLLVTSQYNKQITVWKLNLEGNNNKPSIERVKTLIDSQVEPKSIIFLPEKNDKSIIIYTSDDEYIYMWDYTTENVPKIQCEYDNQSIHLHPNNQDLISVCNQGRISLINLNKKQEVGFFIEKNQIINSNLSTNGSHILLSVLGKQNSINMWNITESELENVFTGYKQTDCLLRPSMNNDYVAIGDEDGKIMIWHKNLPQMPICTIHIDDKKGVKIEQNPIDEKCSYESWIEIFNQKKSSTNMELETCIKNKTTIEPMKEENKNTINQVHFNPVYPGMLIVGSDDNTVRLFISDDVNYKIPEKTIIEKKKQSTIETIKQKVQSLIPCLYNKSSKRSNKINENNNNQAMEEEDDEEEDIEENKQNKKSNKKGVQNSNNNGQDKECKISCEIDEEEQDDNEDDDNDDQNEDDNENDEDDEDDNDEEEDNEDESQQEAGLSSNVNEEQKLELEQTQENNSSSSNLHLNNNSQDN